MRILQSSEDYLETILQIQQEKGCVRSIDIAHELNFSKASVSIAMKNLREKEHITVTEEGFIYLTDSGKEIAEMVYERHEVISECLVRLGVSKEIADEDACRIEHILSDESFEAIKDYLNKL